VVEGDRAVKCWAFLLTGLTLSCSGTDAAPPSEGAAGESAAAGAPSSEGGGGGADSSAAGAPDDVSPGGVVGASGDGGAGGDVSFETGAFYASQVESFEPGTGAGYNQDKLPDVVLGPPQGEGTTQGSLDVLSLGNGGQIVLGFGPRGIVDGPGADFVVFENPFWPEGDPTRVFAELGEVAVSEDGETWHSFECDAAGDGEGHFPGCAGVTPTLAYDAEQLVPLDPEKSGGDAFDLAELGIERARFVRIRDLETFPPGGTSSGFDLDAIGVIHAD
jgi:hypothetical protein